LEGEWFVRGLGVGSSRVGSRGKAPVGDLRVRVPRSWWSFAMMYRGRKQNNKRGLVARISQSLAFVRETLPRKAALVVVRNTSTTIHSNTTSCNNYFIIAQNRKYVIHGTALSSAKDRPAATGTTTQQVQKMSWNLNMWSLRYASG